MRTRLGKNQQKLITLLYLGVAFSLCRSPRRQFKIITVDLPKEFAKINMQTLEYGLHRLVDLKYIYVRKIQDGHYQARLTADGCRHVQSINIRNLKIAKSDKWDKKWRMVFFDIPEKMNKKRNLFRENIKAIGFLEVQRSVFCYPYACGTEIIKIATFSGLSDYIHYAVVEELSDAGHYRKKFGL